MGRTETTDEQGRAILVGLDSKQCVGRGGRTDCRDVSGFLTPEGCTSRSTALHLGQNWGSAAVAVLRDRAR